MMKIVAGMGSIEDYESLVEAGADEVFIGFVPNSWNEKYGNVMPLNRREVLFYHVQIGTYEDMRILFRKMTKYDIPVTITFNSLYYIQEQLMDIFTIIKKLVEIGFKKYIIADINLIRLLIENDVDCDIHISGELGEWNSATIKFLQNAFMKDKAKISRIIFHRQNQISDMESCIHTAKETGLCNEFEAFCMNERCHYTGGFCNSLHADELVHICKLPYQLSNGLSGDNLADLVEEEDEEMEYIPGESGCGLCALDRLKQAGVTHLKVVGRGESVQCMLQDISVLRRALDFLEQASEKQDVNFYRETIQKFFFNGKCSNNCYY